MEQFVEIFTQADATYLYVYIGIMRYLAPALALVLLLRNARPMVSFRRKPEIWAWLNLENGRKIPLTHWENVIGRSKRSDIVVDLPTVSKSHAVLTRYDDGSWTVTDADTPTGVKVNGKKVQISVLQPEDKIDIGGVIMTLTPISHQQEQRLAEIRSEKAGILRALVNLFLLSVFQILCCIAFLLASEQQEAMSIFTGFAGIFVCEWLLLIFYLLIRRTSFDVESIAFFLCTMGMAAIAAVKPN